jgi:hypothetical protein
MSAGTAGGRVIRWRLVVHQFVGPAHRHSPVQVRRQPPTAGIHDQPQVQPRCLFPTRYDWLRTVTVPAGLTRLMKVTPPRRERLPIRRHHEARRQPLQPQLSPAEGRADVLDGPAGETETAGGLTRREVVVHGVLRGGAADGCPRGTF